MNAEMQTCMDACHHCHVTCLSMTTQHCLQVGGAHAAPDHIKIMLDCAYICRACAASCEQVGDMDDCIAACNRCAEECEKMAA